MADPFIAFPIPSEEITDLDPIAGTDIDIDADLILVRNMATGEDRNAIIGDAVREIVNTDISNRIRFVATFADLVNIPAFLNQPIYLEGVTGTLGDRSGFFVARSGSVTADGETKSNSATGGLYWDRTSYDAKSNIKLENYFNTSKDLSGIISTHGKKVVITGDSLSYNNYGFGFPFAAFATDAFAGIRSCGFLLRDAIHMSDPCFVYGDNIPWHINNPANASAGINTTAAYILPFNNRSTKFVVANSSAEITLTLNSFNIQNKQIVLHLAHDPLSSGKFDLYYNLNTGGADVLVQNVQVGNGVNHQGFDPFTITIPANSADSCVRLVMKNFTNVAGAALSSPMAFYVLAAGSKLTQVFTTGVGGANTDFFVTNYAARIGAFAPDILITFLGANDRLNRTLAQHLAALTSIFTSARASNPAVRIIHITAPPADAAQGNPGYYPDTATNAADTVTMREWISGVERLCRDQNVDFFNLYRFLYDVPQSELFVDGIHASRPWGSNTFKAIWSDYFSSASSPINHLSGFSTYSSSGIADLMGRQIGLIEQTKATPKLKGQFRLTYVHGGTPSWTFSNNYEFGTNRPSAIKSVAIVGNAHTTYIEFFAPCIANAYNEFPQPLTATAEYIGGASVLISAVSISPQENNKLRMTIRDLNGALIDPATMNGAQFIIKYRM